MNDISREVRKNIFDGLIIESVYYAGALSDIDFLGRLYDLTSLKSFDDRFQSADGDIWQHRENNFDWSDDWIYSDPRFNLLSCPDGEFLEFLCEMLHPVVRPNKDEVTKIVDHFNDQLDFTGWKLIAAEKIAGRAVFVPVKKSLFYSSIGRATTSAEVLSSNWMQSEIRRIQNSIENDPALAIGTAKDLVESCCKAILMELSVPVGTSDNLPTLAKKLAKNIGLVPEGISKEAKGADNIKRVLSNLASLVNGIAELRGLYGSGHGRDGQHVGLEPRHARLAASCAIAFVDFCTETYVKRKGKRGVS